VDVESYEKDLTIAFDNQCAKVIRILAINVISGKPNEAFVMIFLDGL
jgi:hypothetical protein